jgi:zinc transport system permease protein
MMISALLEFPFWRPLCTAVLLGLFLPVFGRHLVLGRCALLGLAIPQLTMTGIVAAFTAAALHWFPWNTIRDESTLALIGGLSTGVPALLIAGGLVVSRGKTEPWLIFGYLASITSTNLLLAAGPVGETYLKDLLQGRLLLVSPLTLLVLVLTLGIGGAISIVLRLRLLLVLTDPEFAGVAGVNVRRWKQAALLLDGTATGVAVAVAGPNVTFALLVLPALAAAPFAKSLSAHLLFSCTLGALGAAAGFLASVWTDLPSGDCVTGLLCLSFAGVTVGTALFRGRRMRTPAV